MPQRRAVQQSIAQLVCRLIALWLLSHAAWGGSEPVRIGVLSFRAPEPTLAQWQPLATILKQAIPDKDFVIEAYPYAELEAAIAGRQLDFVLTNPGHYLLLNELFGLSAPLATLVRIEKGQALAAFGGVMFCLAKRDDIHRLEDLPHKTVAITDEGSFGGYQMQAYETLRVTAYRYSNQQLIKTGMPHDHVVEAVLAGRADVGFVRTGVLESLVKEGKLAMEQIKIINPQNLPNFPWQVSTRLYPEWPFAALPHIDSQLARKVAATLFTLESQSPPLIPEVYGFTIPADYMPVANLLRTLRLPPFDVEPTFTLHDVWVRYRGLLVYLGAGLLLVVFLALRLFNSNRHLREKQKLVQQQTQALQDSEQRWKFALEGAGDGVWDWDVVSGHVFYSDNWQTMLGYQPGSIANDYQGWANLLHPDDLEAAQNELQRYLAGQTPYYRTEFRMCCRNGDYKWILSRGMAVNRDAAGTPLRLIGTHTDMSERKQIELDLQRNRDALLRSNADLEQFAYSVSHDMRQPLRMVSGHLQLLARQLQQHLDAESLESLNFALDGAKRMDAMIVSLLEYSRVGRKTDAMAMIDSRVILNEALMFLQPTLEETQAVLGINGNWPVLYASADEISRLLQNLLANALKYHPPGQTPLVDILSSDDHQYWRLQVCDNGIGINPNQIGRLFQFFSRLNTRNRFEGTGMGLALCRRIVEHHGGRIWVESQGEGLGSCFCFELPIARQDPVTAELLVSDK